MRADSPSFSTAIDGEGMSGLPNPRSITSAPFRRASIFKLLMIVKTYGGRLVIRRNSMTDDATARGPANPGPFVRMRNSVRVVGLEKGGADRSGILAEVGQPDRRMGTDVRRVEMIGEVAFDRMAYDLGPMRDSTSDHHRLRIDHMDQGGDAECDPIRELVDHPQCRFVPALGGPPDDDGLVDGVIAGVVAGIVAGIIVTVLHRPRPLGTVEQGLARQASKGRP